MRKLNDFELEQVSGGRFTYVYPYWRFRIEDDGASNIVLGMAFIGIGIYQLAKQHAKQRAKQYEKSKETSND